MKPENKAFLEEKESVWITLRDAGYMIGLDGNTRSRMVEIIKEEFQPGYATDLWCPPCVGDMVTLLYRYFNEWREKNREPALADPLHRQKADMVAKVLESRKEPPTPVIKAPEPIQTKASFPKHNQPHRRR